MSESPKVPSKEATPPVARIIQGCTDFKSPVVALVSIVAIGLIISLGVLPHIGLGPTTFALLQVTLGVSSLVVGLPVLVILTRQGISRREARNERNREAVQRLRDAPPESADSFF